MVGHILCSIINKKPNKIFQGPRKYFPGPRKYPKASAKYYLKI